MKKVMPGLAAVTLVTTLATLAVAQNTLRTYYANDPVGRNVVMIESRAPLETILTRSNQVTGEIHLNPTDLIDNPKAHFELDAASLDTGITLRNEHMRGADWLDTAKYPKVVFDLERMIVLWNGPPPTIDGIARKPLELSGMGNLTLHGVTHVVPVKLIISAIAGNAGTAHRLPGDLLHVRATFSLKLDDYGIKMPAMAQPEVANEQQVTADIFTSTELPKPPQP